MTLFCDDCLGTFDVDSVPLVNGDPRWCAYDLRPLTDGQEVRGTDTPIPLSPFIIQNPRRFSPTTYLLPFAITGWVDAGGYEIGAIGADGRAIASWRSIRGQLIGERTFTYIEPSGAIWIGPGHVIDLDQTSMDQGIWDGIIEILLTEPWVVT